MMDRPVHVATVVRPHGLRGEVIADGLGAPAPVVAALPVLLTRAGSGWRRWPLRAVRPHGGRLLLSFEGVDSFDQAAALRGQELFIDEDQLPALPPGTHYSYRLTGLRVEDEAGTLLGRVRGTEAGAVQDRLIVETVAGGEAQVPMVPALIRSIDLAGGRVVVDVPEGLLSGAALVAASGPGEADGEPER